MMSLGVSYDADCRFEAMKDAAEAQKTLAYAAQYRRRKQTLHAADDALI